MERCMGFKVFMLNQLPSSLRIPKETLGMAQELFVGKRFISVKGPSGECNISVKISQEAVTLKKGWAEFKQAHSLCNTDELIFIGGCNDIFYVLIFDKDGKAVGKRLRSSDTEAGGLTPQHNDIEAQSNYKKRKAVASKLRLSDKRKDPSKPCTMPSISKLISNSLDPSSDNNLDPSSVNNSDSSSGNNCGQGQASSVKKAYANRETSDTSDSSNSESDIQETIEVKIKKTFISHRRPVSLVEVKKTKQRAEGFRSSRPYFVKQVNRNNVYANFYFNVPINFARSNLPDSITKIFLQVPGMTEKWVVGCKFRWFKKRKQHVCSMIAGWWKFSLANNLEEGDTLVFEMMTEEPHRLANSIVEMKVHIFRVVEKIKPLQVL